MSLLSLESRKLMGEGGLGPEELLGERKTQLPRTLRKTIWRKQTAESGDHWSSGSWTVLVRVLQRNRTNRMCIYRQIYFKELAHEVVEPCQVQNLM